jgi:hypothetical protein
MGGMEETRKSYSLLVLKRFGSCSVEEPRWRWKIEMEAEE